MTRSLLLLALLVATLPAQARTLLASIPPLAQVSAAVAPADTDIKVLVPRGSSTHDFQLSPGGLEAIAAADIVVWAGADAEPYLAPVLAQPRAGQQVIDLSRLPGVVRRELRQDPLETRSWGRDPHLWLSTRNAALLAGAVGAALGNAPAAQAFADELQRFRNRQGLRFRALADAPLFTAHDAYGYLFDEIGLRNVTAVVASPEQQLSTRRFAELAKRAQEQRLGCMVGEPGFEADGVAARLVDGRARLVVIDPQLASFSPGRDSFLIALIHVADTLYGCMATRPPATPAAPAATGG